MQIEIDFEVFKALTTLRENEADSYNHVLRRLLKLAPPARPLGLEGMVKAPKRGGLLGSFEQGFGGLLSPNILDEIGGAVFNGVHFPEGTQFRAVYKGVPHTAEIRNGKWVDSSGSGVVRKSPSDAANAISDTNVNGWRFWSALRPGDSEWRRLEEFKS